MSARSQSAGDALDAWVLGLVAQKARESVPGGDEELAFSALMSEMAGDPYLYKMRWSQVVRVDQRRAVKARCE